MRELFPYPQKGTLVILGAGESGVGAAILGKQKGFQVFVSDAGQIADSYKQILNRENIDFEEGKHTESRLLEADLIIKSPGIPPTVPVIQKLKQVGKSIIGEIEFAAQYTNAKIIGITGSNGKSTTSMLTYTLLKDAGLHVGLAGNIGQSFALQVAQENFDLYVLEISSFMLDDMKYFKADISILLNITPDHLDRYEHSMEKYIESKMGILRNQTEDDYFIYCMDDPNITHAIEKREIKAHLLPFSLMKTVEEGAFQNENKELVIKLRNREEFKMNIDELSLQGKHNVYNNMASGLVAKVQELRNATMKESMGSYQNIPHRLEFVACIAGINYINDSKATNVNSVWYALESFPESIVLIMGGVDKGNDYSMLTDLVKSKVRAIICIGKDNSRIHDSFEDTVDIIMNSSNMKDAVELASNLATKGDTVLLSPACASFDWFKNYEDRGDQFKQAVLEL